MEQEVVLSKKRQLKKHKALATYFFIIMVLIYGLMVYLLKNHPEGWMGYVKAFAEAAMVGALADWFAVTALFHHPLGLRIPHTNLIEHKKQDIGDNLGSFVVENFLNPATLKPYFAKIQVAGYAADWLENEKNRKMVIAETTKMVQDLLAKTDDVTVSLFLAAKGKDLLQTVKMGPILSGALKYLVDQGEDERLLNFLLEKIKVYVAENEDMVRRRVKKESGILVPGFVDNMLANRITVGLANYLHEIQQDDHHQIRMEIKGQLQRLVTDLKDGNSNWKADLDKLKNGLLSESQLQQYAGNLWQYLKKILEKELSPVDGTESSALMRYVDKNLLAFAGRLKTEASLRDKIDQWVRFTAYRLALRSTDQVGSMISQTVGNWEGKELSEKLELEVGKDLQFIRINGTLVGGLVGLLIYIITQWL